MRGWKQRGGGGDGVIYFYWGGGGKFIVVVHFLSPPTTINVEPKFRTTSGGFASCLWPNESIKNELKGRHNPSGCLVQSRHRRHGLPPSAAALAAAAPATPGAAASPAAAAVPAAARGRPVFRGGR